MDNYTNNILGGRGGGPDAHALRRRGALLSAAPEMESTTFETLRWLKRRRKETQKDKRDTETAKGQTENGRRGRDNYPKVRFPLLGDGAVLHVHGASVFGWRDAGGRACCRVCFSRAIAAVDGCSHRFLERCLIGRPLFRQPAAGSSRELDAENPPLSVPPARSRVAASRAAPLRVHFRPVRQAGYITLYYRIIA